MSPPADQVVHLCAVNAHREALVLTPVALEIGADAEADVERLSAEGDRDRRQVAVASQAPLGSLTPVEAFTAWSA